jgi:hypothetical protein
MARIIKIKNTGIDGTWVGQEMLSGVYYNIDNIEIDIWTTDDDVFADIASGTLIVNSGADIIDDISNPIQGWDWMSGSNEFPTSDIDGKKIAVHASPKPLNNGITIYALWIGAGDDLTTGEIGGGDLMEFNLSPGTASHSIDMKFDPDNGTVWIHEGYLRFADGGSGDYFEASVVGEATPLQTVVNLDLILDIDGTTVKYSPTGAGTGTHGFADASKVVLGRRAFSQDGDWDYNESTGSLLPNMAGTGLYKISTMEQVVHRFMHKVSVRGMSNTYFNMSSEESTIILPNYYLQITAHNVSDTTWNASALIEVYRERTFNP